MKKSITVLDHRYHKNKITCSPRIWKFLWWSLPRTKKNISKKVNIPLVKTTLSNVYVTYFSCYLIINLQWIHIPFVSTPFIPGSEKKKVKWIKIVASIRLKIGQRVAYRFTIFPFPQISCFQNSYGFRAIWSQIFSKGEIYLSRSSAQGSHEK